MIVAQTIMEWLGMKVIPSTWLPGNRIYSMIINQPHIPLSVIHPHFHASRSPLATLVAVSSIPLFNP